MPPTQAEYKRAAKAQTEFVKDVNFEEREKERTKVKRKAKRYKEYFADRVKHCQKPAESADLETWKEFLSDMQCAIGGEKAHESFNFYKDQGAMMIENASLQWPELFAGRNLHHPNSLYKTVSSPEFNNLIDDERAEICILHEEWFSSGPWSRLASNFALVLYQVSEANAAAQASSRREEGAFDHLVSKSDEE